MATKKINTDSLIGLELEKLQSKVDQFQDYLEINSITQYSNIRVDEIEEDIQDKLHKEIIVQIKMQDAIFNWLPLLEKLKEASNENNIELRGGAEFNGLMQKAKNNK